MTAAYFEEHPTDPDKVIMRKPPLEVQESPKYSFKAHWEKDGRIGVVGAIVRPDGGIHLLQDIIDPPQRTWVGLTEDERDHLAGLHLYAVRGQVEAWIEGVDDFAQAIEAKLKEKNSG